jgi:membrane associated rhomboid family serine protease
MSPIQISRGVWIYTSIAFNLAKIVKIVTIAVVTQIALLKFIRYIFLMFPIWDDQVKGWYMPYVTRCIIAINILVFLYQMSLGDVGNEWFIAHYAVTPAQVMQWQNRVSLLTSMFMHGSIMHIAGNMLFLKVFGDNIEARLGNIRFLLFYLAAWVIASFGHIFTDISSLVPSLGASGAISGVLGAYLVLFPQSRIKILNIATWQVSLAGASQFLIYWIGLQFVSGVGSLAAAGGAGWWVAWFAHIGGFVAGWIWGKMHQRQSQEAVDVIVDEQNRFMR